MTIIHLSWPDSCLLPNNQRGKKLFNASVIKNHRREARMTMASTIGRGDHRAYKLRDNMYTCRIRFHPPDRRRRDLGNMFSACKAYIDGVADALGIDDYQIVTFVIERGIWVSRGDVEIEI